MSDVLTDELCHLVKEPRILSLEELMGMDTSGDEDVVLHNTMRFDVQLLYIQPVLDAGDVDKKTLIEAIRKGIVEAVEDVVGKGLDGSSIPCGAMVTPVVRSQMLHRETIHFDLS